MTSSYSNEAERTVSRYQLVPDRVHKRRLGAVEELRRIRCLEFLPSAPQRAGKSGNGSRQACKSYSRAIKTHPKREEAQENEREHAAYNKTNQTARPERQ